MNVDAVVLLGAALLPGFWALGARERMTRLRLAARAAWQRVDERLKLRHELLQRFIDGAGPGMPGGAEQVAALAAARNSAAAARQGAAAQSGAATALSQLARAEAALNAALVRVLDPLIAARDGGLHDSAGALAVLADVSAGLLPVGGAELTPAGRVIVAPGSPGAALAGAAAAFDPATDRFGADLADDDADAEVAPPPVVPVEFPPPGLFVELDAACVQVDVARHAYNAAAEAFNHAIGQFPARLLAGFLRLKPIGEALPLASRAAIAPMLPRAGDE